MKLAVSIEENKSKKLNVIFYVERIGSCSPKFINKCLTILQIPVSDTDSAQWGTVTVRQFNYDLLSVSY